MPPPHPLPGSLPRPASVGRNADSQLVGLAAPPFPALLSGTTKPSNPVGVEKLSLCSPEGCGKKHPKAYSVWPTTGAARKTSSTRDQNVQLPQGNNREGRESKERKLKVKRTEKAQGVKEKKRGT